MPYERASSLAGASTLSMSFDNMLPLYEDENHDLLETKSPFARSHSRQSSLNRVDPNRKDAIINLGDIYAGPGLDRRPSRDGQEACV